MGTAKREAKIRRSVEVPNPPAKDELRAIIDTHQYSSGPTCPTDIAISSISVG